MQPLASLRSGMGAKTYEVSSSHVPMLSKANSRRLEFLVLHNPSFFQPRSCPDAMRQRRDTLLVSPRYRPAKNSSEHCIVIRKVMYKIPDRKEHPFPIRSS